jgi:hypothetical protein
MTSLDEPIHNLTITLLKLQNCLNGTFYDRRKSVITEFNVNLNKLIDILKHINMLFEGNSNNYNDLESKYTKEWATNDFYSYYKQWIASYIYDYQPSITYHQLKHIANDMIMVCLKKLGKITEQSNCENLTLYCRKEDVIDTTGSNTSNLVKIFTNITKDLNALNITFEQMYADNTTKRLI